MKRDQVVFVNKSMSHIPDEHIEALMNMCVGYTDDNAKRTIVRCEKNASADHFEMYKQGYSIVVVKKEYEA